ncbi:redoxin domain-containing protein [Candidatus Wolfebacteria bacterium]|nr:redoxin domain-containing protein [Candidatus Wolfebacteria bacterium]
MIKIIVSAIAVFGLISLIWIGRGNQTSESSKINSAVDFELKEKIDFKKAIGEKAPDFWLESIDGKIIKLSDYFGKKNIVLFFNEGAMCYPACWNQIAELGNDSRFDIENTEVFSIVTDSKSQWIDIVSKSPNMSKSKILFDTARFVSSAYGVLNLESSMHPGGFPGHTYFVIDKEGIIKFTLDDPNMALSNDKLIEEIDKLKS